MKSITKTVNKPSLKKKIKISFKYFFIIIANCVCLTIYTLLFLIPAILVVNFSIKEISYLWFIVPLIGIILGILQIHYINTGSLITRTIVMMTICLIVFIVPIVISFII